MHHNSSSKRYVQRAACARQLLVSETEERNFVADASQRGSVTRERQTLYVPDGQQYGLVPTKKKKRGSPKGKTREGTVMELTFQQSLRGRMDLKSHLLASCSHGKHLFLKNTAQQQSH